MTNSTSGSRFRWTTGIVAAVLGVGAMGSAAAVPAAAADPAPSATGKNLTVDLSDVTKPSNNSAQGLLYGITQDGSQPADQYLKPLDINSFRGGGWFAGGWLGDGYQLGPKTQAEIDAIIDQATRLKSLSSHPDDFHYEVILSDLWGSTGGAPVNSKWPCANGDCTNYVQFITQTVTQLEASGIDFSYDIWNEPDLDIFWRPGGDTPQYYAMWDTAYATLRQVAPNAPIVGPSFAYTPERKPTLWKHFFAHVKDANTIPDWVSNHNEGEGGVAAGADDPVVVSKLLRDFMDEAGISQRPLSSNEYQGAGIQTAGVTAWYVNRLAQSTYSAAMRGNWNCCMIPNLTGLLSHAQTGWAPTGNWWALRVGADMSSNQVKTSEQVDTLAISATRDDSAQRAVALLGDLKGYSGAANVTFSGLDATPYLVRDGKVHATVYGLPEGVLYAPQVQFSGELPVSADGKVVVPTSFAGNHDAAAVYLSWTDGQSLSIGQPDEFVPGGSYDVPVTVTNGSGTVAEQVKTALSITAEDPAKTEGIEITCSENCEELASLAPGASAVVTFHIAVPASAPTMAYRLVGTADMTVAGAARTASNSVDLIGACVPGSLCEAEDGQLFGGACFATNHSGYTGSGFVACFDTTVSGRGVTQQFSVPDAGDYKLDLRYAAGPDGPAAKSDRTMTVTVGSASQQVQLPPTGSWDKWGVTTVTVHLEAGQNDITVVKGAADNGWINLDSLKLAAPVPAGPKVVVSTATRCVAGKVVLIVTASNQDQGSATVSTDTAYGKADFGPMVAGKTLSKSLPTRLASTPAGTVTTTATAAGTSVIETPVAAATCG